MSTTVYKVEIIYDMKGNAGAGLKNLERTTKSATNSAFGLKSALSAVAAGGLFAAGKKFFFDYNREIDKMKISLATVTAMNFKKPFDAGRVAADKLFATFQKMAIESPATTKDFVSMSSMISGAVLQAGMGLKDLEQITKGAVIASQALGAPAEMMALDVSQMLSGSVGLRDRYARQLLSSMGHQDYKAFNKLDAKKRAQITKSAFEQAPIQDAAKAFGSSTEGVMSTMQDNLEIALGKVGLPLMKAMTEEVKSWNTWFSSNPEKIQAMGEKFASGLKEAFFIIKDIAQAMFPMIKDVFGVVASVLKFASEHREVLVGLIKAMAVYKGVSFVGGGMMKGGGGAFDGLKKILGLSDDMRFGTIGLKEGFKGILDVLGGPVGVISALAKLSMGAWALGKILFGNTDSEKKKIAAANAQLKTAKEFQGKFEEYQSALEKRKKYGQTVDGKNVLDQGFAESIGVSDAQIAGMKQSMDQYMEKQLDAAIKAGHVTEEITPGVRRKLIFTPSTGGLTGAEGKDVWDSQHKANQETMKSLEYIFKTQAELNGGVFRGLAAVTATNRFAGSFTQALTGGPTAPEDLYGQMPPPPKTKIDVNINKIEVASNDPDRFVFGAVRAFEEVARNPTSAEGALRGGF